MDAKQIATRSLRVAEKNNDINADIIDQADKIFLDGKRISKTAALAFPDRKVRDIDVSSNNVYITTKKSRS